MKMSSSSLTYKMSSINQYLSFFILTFFILLTTSNSRIIDTKLPEGLFGASAIYDGDDYIYIFGGQTSSNVETDQILRFTISTEEIEKLEAVMPNKGSYGSVQSDSEGNIFYFGGYYDYTHDAVFKFDPKTQSCTNESILPHNVWYAPSVEFEDMVYIFGSLGDHKIQSFNMKNLESETVGAVPQLGTAFAPTAVRVGDIAYLFNDGSSVGAEIVLKFDLKDPTKDLEEIETRLPGMKAEHPSSLYDGEKYIYIVGGYKQDSGTETNGLLRIDPETLIHDFMPVEDFIIEGNIHFETAPAAVLVNNGVYLFGGKSANATDYFGGKIHDEILYVAFQGLIPASTTTPAPTTTSTTTTTTSRTTTEEIVETSPSSTGTTTTTTDHEDITTTTDDTASPTSSTRASLTTEDDENDPVTDDDDSSTTPRNNGWKIYDASWTKITSFLIINILFNTIRC